MTASVIALVIALINHQAEITNTIQGIFADPDNVDVEKVLGRIDSGLVQLKKLQEEVGQ